MIKHWKKGQKRLDHWDTGLIKLSSMAFILFLITVSPALMTLVQSIHWGWFLAATIVFAARPWKRAYM